MGDTIRKNNMFFRQLLFLSILILMGAVMLRHLAFFIGSFLGAITFYIVFREVAFRLIERHKWKPWLASLTIVIAIMFMLAGLGFLIFEILAKQINNVDPAQLMNWFRSAVPKINDLAGFSLISHNMVSESAGVISKMLGTVLNTTYSFAANIFMTIIILYFMLTHARLLEEKVSRYMPFRGESREMLGRDIRAIIFSNAVGIPVMMLGQGLVSALIYWLFGIPNVALWAFLTALCGLIPMVGTVIVSLPLGIWLIAQGFVLKGIGLALCGLLVIANVDNLLRIIMNQRLTDTHPLTVIFGVILGIPLFGFWGIIFGPLMISVFLLLIKIYYTEYKLVGPEPAVEPTLSPTAEKVVEEVRHEIEEENRQIRGEE